MTPGPIPGVAAHLKILIVTDAWAPQVNGVVRTLEILRDDLAALGHRVHMITPQGRPSLPLPTYPEIRMVLFARTALTREIRDFAPDAVHIATEGPLGLAARAVFVLDEHDKVRHAQLVPEIGQEPDYAAALAALR